MLRAWCARNGVSGKSGRETTHVLMDGGVLSVPQHLDADFMDACVASVAAGERIFVVEKKTPIFNFLVDVDYKADEALDADAVRSLCEFICASVRDATKLDAECIACVSNPKPCRDKIKTGVHLVWGKMPVNAANALVVRDRIVADLAAKDDAHPWTDIIDAAVYKGSGLRAPWSHKKARHEACSGAGCPDCSGSGRVDEMPYLPLYAVTSKRTRVLSQAPDAKTLAKSSVRTRATQSVVSVASGSTDASNVAPPTRVWDTPLVGALQTFVRDNMEGQSDAQLTGIYRQGDAVYAHTRSRYCENLGRAHRSTHVWFMVAGGHVHQRCFCRCETTDGRKGGFCSGFRGQSHRLPPSVASLLEKHDAAPRLPQRATKLSVASIMFL